MNADLLNWIPRLVRALVDARYYKQAIRGPTAMKTKWLVLGHYCRREQIRIGDLTVEIPWSYPLSHDCSSVCGSKA